MAENIIVYAGVNRIGKLRKAALEKEARRQGKGVSVADVFWNLARKCGSPELKADLEAAEKERPS